jgi:hypothetical protein
MESEFLEKIQLVHGRAGAKFLHRKPIIGSSIHITPTI